MMSFDLRMSDREQIRDVLRRYCRGIDRRHFKLLMDCYHPDSIDQYASFTGSGADFCAYAMKAVSRAIFTQHFVSNVLFQFEGMRAFVESCPRDTPLGPNGALVDFLHYGRYCDIFERREGQWKIFYRLHLPDGDNITNVEEPVGRSSRQEMSDRYHARGIAVRSDPSYLAFQIPTMYRAVAPIMEMFEKHLEDRMSKKSL
jgi:hypothetical protein